MYRLWIVIVPGSIIAACISEQVKKVQTCIPIESRKQIDFEISSDVVYAVYSVWDLPDEAYKPCYSSRYGYNTFKSGTVRLLVFPPRDINEIARCSYKVFRRLLHPDDDPPGEGYYTNIYYLLPERSGSCKAPDSMFHVVVWEPQIPNEEPDAKDGVLCPKIIYAGKDVREQMLKESCYSIAGFDKDALVPCWETDEGKWYYLPDNTDGLGPERMGCKSLSPKRAGDKKFVQFVFYTDRLSAFRLLPATDEERERVRDWRKPGSTFLSPDGICEVVPDSSRWAYRFGISIEKIETVFGRLLCRDDDCRDGQHCVKPEKSCRPDLGMCIENNQAESSER